MSNLVKYENKQIDLKKIGLKGAWDLRDQIGKVAEVIDDFIDGEIERLAAQGLSQSDIAKKCGRSQPVVSRRMARLGIEASFASGRNSPVFIRPNKNVTEPGPEDIEELDDEEVMDEHDDEEELDDEFDDDEFDEEPEEKPEAPPVKKRAAQLPPMEHLTSTRILSINVSAAIKELSNRVESGKFRDDEDEKEMIEWLEQRVSVWVKRLEKTSQELNKMQNHKRLRRVK